MMNVKETLKRLHKRLPTLSLDELFELLDCYVGEYKLSNPFPTWEPSSKIWYSTDKTNGVGETAKATSITTNTDSGIYTIANNCTNGKIKLYDGGSSVQLTADH